MPGRVHQATGGPATGLRFDAMADLLLYDGVCGLCRRLVRFVLRRDARGQVRFAALQGPLAAELLRRHGRDAGDLDAVCLVSDYGSPGERLHVKARAVLRAAGALGGLWRAARALEILPTRLLDAAYDLVAARRYRWFGRSESCLAAPAEHRSRFLDDAAGPGVRPPRAAGPPPHRIR
jgi:predicted DCC family thiol-disulfide oxidoreductase YuxK